ncbi:kinase-like domain-containing protein [Bisporella sp. PMI_857]|nr:kinase-like domain-containing protein [Bisporella sp. PMI_857]
MQSNLNLTSQNAPALRGDNHDRLSDIYVISRIVDADSTEEHSGWQTIHHPSPSFKTSLPYDALKPQGPASICEEGGYATVSLYLPDKTFVLKGSEVWVDGKCLSKRLSPLSVASIMREDAVYKRLGSHPFILNYDGKVLVNGNVYSLKIERALGCLRKFILNCPAPSKKTRLDMAVQAVASISYTHSKNVIHADFSTRNLFVFDNWQLKLGDFGGSRIDDQAALAAEEALYQLPRYGRTWRELDETKRELFALGCGIYEIITWKTLYAELPAQQAVAKHNKGEFPDTRDLLAGNIICKCWHEKYNAAVDVEKDLRKELADIKRDM